MAYGARTDLSIHETGLPAALGYLIKTDLLPHAKRDSHAELESGLHEMVDDGRRLFAKIVQDLKEVSPYSLFCF